MSQPNLNFVGHAKSLVTPPVDSELIGGTSISHYTKLNPSGNSGHGTTAQVPFGTGPQSCRQVVVQK